MRRHCLAAFALLGLFTASCKKGDQPDSHNTVRLKHMEHRSAHYTDITYNAQGLPATFKSVEDNLSTQASFTYNSARQLSGGSLESYKLSAVYRNGNIDTVYLLEQSGTMAHFITFSYKGSRVSDMTYYYATPGKPSAGLRVSYDYNAAGDLQTRTRLFADVSGQFSQLEKTTYEYDRKVAAQQSLSGLSYLLDLNPSAHNAVREVVYNEDNQLTEIRAYSYVYNSADAPVSAKEKITYPNSPELNSTITYSYE